MSREAARIALMDKLQALHLANMGVPIELPNEVAIDPDKATAPFLKVNIEFPSSFQASLGDPRHLRVVGMLTMEAWLNTGSGTKRGNEILEYFSIPFSQKDFGVARCRAVHYGKSFPMKGWRVEPAIIPFWFDDFN